MPINLEVKEVGKASQMTSYLLVDELYIVGEFNNTEVV